MRRFRFLAILVAAAGMTLAATGTARSSPVAAHPAGPQLAATDAALVSVALPSKADVESLIGSGVEVEGQALPLPGGALQVDAVLTGAEVSALIGNGGRLLRIVERQGDGSARYLASVQAAQARTAAGLSSVKQAGTVGAAVTAGNADTLHFLQNYWWTSQGHTFAGTEVATTATDDPNVQITITWRTADGRTGSYQLQRFSDDNEYQYHFADPQPVPAKPVSFVATSSLGGRATATPQAWPGLQPPPTPTGYQQDFITQYMTPEDVTTRIQRLAHQYPSLVDVINLPNKTQGYRRTASGYVGDPASAAVIVESVQFGDQGWNGVHVKSVKPAGHNRPLTVHYANRTLTVSLATNSRGAPTSTTGQVAAAIRSRVGSKFHAYVKSGQAGKVLPVSSATLSDGLKAGSNVPHSPWTVQALRIGVHRDGSRIGVLTYSQEHAREWAVPLVTLEFAERLLANYATDPQTHTLLNDVDVFVVPVTNPDGANYSFNDYNFQRKNMDDYCKGALRDPANRDAFGVDVNRNYAVGSLFDGYFGASTDCLDEVSAGTGELSEPESRNIIALAKAHPNIKYAMNVHSYGGFFMWPPGAYKEAGRITLPRPSIQESAEFLSAAQQIVTAISGYRGTVTWPQRTGPVADVLYSAAGNSADELYYEDGIFAWDFEVGNFIWNSAAQEWDGPGFQPPYAEAHAEAMEYAAGLVQLVKVADAYQKAHPTAVKH